MPKTEPIRCPVCGAPMNRHAEKLVPGATFEDPTEEEVALGGALEEFHTCTRCHNVVERRLVPS